jgi:hypothetical protein
MLTVIMPSIYMYIYAECHYAECHGAYIFTLYANIFTKIKVIKNTFAQTQNLLKMPSAFMLGLN